MIMSTGMSSAEEIQEAVDAARQSGAKDIALLKCVSCYPAKPREMNLRTISDMKKRFKCSAVGLSDHTPGTAVAVAAVSLGAQIVEKHFTLSRSIKTPDSFFSIEPEELKELVDHIRIAEDALGGIHYGLTAEESKSRVFRRSLFAVEDIKNGDLFTESNVRSIRPANGMRPKYLKNILGKKSKKNIKAGTPFKSDFYK